MYSVVLMAVLTAGSTTPDWHRYGGCCGGCFGCCGGCYGCFGGCCGGCFGGCCGGCFGGCCGGCCGGGLGVGIGDGFGDGHGAPMSSGAIVPDGYGAPMSSGATVPGNGMIAPGTGVSPGGTATPTGEPLGAPKDNKGKDRDKTDQGTRSSTSAKLIVELPANAKLFIDDIPVKSTAGVRTFHTPALEPGRLYYYMVRIERMPDGQPVSETRRIIVHAGQVARADFQEVESEAVRTAQAK